MFESMLVSEYFITFNLLRCNDVPRTSRIFCPKLQHFHSFKYI